MPVPFFKDIASRWLSASAGTMSVRTIEHYRTFLERYVFPTLGESLNITEEDVRRLMDEKQVQGFSDGTVYTIPKLVWRILSFASAEGLCEAPGWEIATSTPGKKKSTVILSFDQEQRMLKYLFDNPNPKHLALYLMLTTGISTGEVLSLTWADVSLNSKRIRVLMDDEATSASKDNYRFIPINERQRMYLKQMQSAPSTYLVNGKTKKGWAGILTPTLSEVSRELHLPNLSPFDLRRTYAVHCLEKGMSFEQVAKALGLKNDRNFRAFYRKLVSTETRERLEKETLAARKVREAPEHINCIGPDLAPEVVALRQKVEAKKKQLEATLAALEGDLEIINALRFNDLPGPGKAREGFYKFVEKVLGDDRDGKMLVEYLRCNMRVASMPSRADVTVQTIRSRVGRGFAKLTARLDNLNAVEGWDILPMFRSLVARVLALAPPAPSRPGPKRKPSIGNDYQDAMAALDRLEEVVNDPLRCRERRCHCRKKYLLHRYL